MAVDAHGTHGTDGAHGDLSEHAGDPHTGAHGDHPTLFVYWTVFILLMLLLGAAVASGYFISGTWGTLLGFGIGVAKAVLIVMFFMHVRYGTRLTWVFSTAAFLWLAILLVFVMNDYLTRAPEGKASRADPVNQQTYPIITTDSARGPIDRP